MSLELNDEYKGHPASEDADAPEFKSLQDAQIEQVSLESDYEGNWSELFECRLSDESSANKYVCVESGKSKVDEDDECDRKLKDIYERIVRVVFKRKDVSVSSTDLSNENNPIKPSQGGKGGFLKRPIVFSDATAPDGSALDDYGRSVIKAHEQAHGVLNKLAERKKDIILSVFEEDFIANFQTKIIASQEILARLTQLKNYFGMSKNEEFNKYHLDYARRHYTEDTGLDNSMSEMLKAINDDEKFLILINSFPC